MADEIVTLTQDPKTTDAMGIVKRNMLWSAGVGFLPIPLVELVAITTVELKLIKELTDHYGIPFRHDLAKSAIVSLLGGLGSVTIGKALAYSTLRFIPFIGPVVAATSLPAVAAGATYAIGRIFISHFDMGGTLLDFDPAKVREHFRSEFASGVKEAASAATGSTK